jgi:hypothetical protein
MSTHSFMVAPASFLNLLVLSLRGCGNLQKLACSAEELRAHHGAASGGAAQLRRLTASRPLFLPPMMVAVFSTALRELWSSLLTGMAWQQSQPPSTRHRPAVASFLSASTGASHQGHLPQQAPPYLVGAAWAGLQSCGAWARVRLRRGQRLSGSSARRSAALAHFALHS